MSGTCKTCGVDLDRIPLIRCTEHAAYDARQSVGPEETVEELIDRAYYEAMSDFNADRID